MTNINYAVSVTSGSISDLPGYIKDWKINAVDLISTGGASNTYASELAYIKSLKLTPRLDIEMDIWAGGQIQSAISNFSGYLQNVKAVGWPAVSSEGGRAGDANYIKSLGLGYVNYNCDQCGLWNAGLHTEAGTVMNLWEAYYPSEVSYIQQGASSGKPNGVLAGAWANSGGDNQILSNSLGGGTPSYKSIFDWFVANGHPIDTFEVWGGTNSSRGENTALGFDGIVANLQKYYPPNGVGPSPGPAPSTVVPADFSYGIHAIDPDKKTITFTGGMYDANQKLIANAQINMDRSATRGVKDGSWAPVGSAVSDANGYYTYTAPLASGANYFWMVTKDGKKGYWTNDVVYI